MVKITGNFGKVKSWINRLIRVKATGNTFAGEDAGKITTGNYNNFMGHQAGYSNTAGNYNNFVGYLAGYSNTTGNSNNFVGGRAGFSNTTGNNNNFVGYRPGYFNTTGYNNNSMGYQAGFFNISGYSNNFMGHQAGYSNVDGNNNTCIGSLAGYTNIHGHGNCNIGYKAGYFETGNYKLFIDDAARADEADGRIKALIYGVFNTLTANQRLRINAILELTEISEYADNAAAITGGLTTNQVYRTGDALKIVH